MSVLERLIGSRPARIGIILLWLMRGESDSVGRADEDYPERPAALAASDTPDSPN